MRVCLYCGVSLTKEVRSAEHVVPKWIMKKYNSLKVTHTFKSIYSNQTSPRITTPSGNQFKIKKVCKKCNNGWLSEIDSSSQPFFNRITAGDVDMIDPSEMEIASIPNFLTLLYKIHLNFFAASNFDLTEKLYSYEKFFKERRIPDDVTVFYSVIQTPQPINIANNDIWNKLPKNEPFSFKTFIQIGYSTHILVRQPQPELPLI